MLLSKLEPVIVDLYPTPDLHLSTTWGEGGGCNNTSLANTAFDSHWRLPFPRFFSCSGITPCLTIVLVPPSSPGRKKRLTHDSAGPYSRFGTLEQVDTTGVKSTVLSWSCPVCSCTVVRISERGEGNFLPSALCPVLLFPPSCPLSDPLVCGFCCVCFVR